MLCYRHTRISGSLLGIAPKDCVATFGQPRQACGLNHNAPPHVRRQKGSVAVDEYEQRLSGPTGTAGQAPSHGQESPAEDKAVEKNRAATVFASVDGEGRRAGANGSGADGKNRAGANGGGADAKKETAGHGVHGRSDGTTGRTTEENDKDGTGSDTASR